MIQLTRSSRRDATKTSPGSRLPTLRSLQVTQKANDRHIIVKIVNFILIIYLYLYSGRNQSNLYDR